MTAQSSHHPPSDVYLYFLDWRPTPALPAAVRGDVRKARVEFSDINSSIYRELPSGPRRRRRVTRLRTGLIPHADAFEFAEAIGRNDGLFVARLKFNGALAQRFDFSKDADELARVVCMAIKVKLGHTHFFHNMPNRTRTRRLSPGGVLKNYPVEIESRDGGKIFSAGRLGDRILASAKVRDSGKKPESFGSRIAVVHLRRSFFKVYDDLCARISRDRQDEIRFYKRPFVNILGFLMGLFVSTSFTIFLIKPEWSAESLLPGIRYPKMDVISWFSIFVSGILIWQSFETLASMVGHTLHRVKLVRAAHGYFSTAQPLNDVVQSIGSRSIVSSVSGFSSILEMLQSVSEGESHRVAMKQFWASFAVALAALIISTLGLALQTSQAAQERTPTNNSEVVITPPPAIWGQ